MKAKKTKKKAKKWKFNKETKKESKEMVLKRPWRESFCVGDASSSEKNHRRLKNIMYEMGRS